MKLYTGKGDAGETSLADGARVPKDHARVRACGELDELSAVLGWCRAAAGGAANLAGIHAIQHELFALGAELALPGSSVGEGGSPGITRDDCRRLEAWIDEATARLEPLREFVLPGGTEPACRLHVARTCCRRAERSVVVLARSDGVRPDVLVYLNRLSDLLFAWARMANYQVGEPDVTWKKTT